MTGEYKVIGGSIILTMVIIIGGVLLLSSDKEPSVPDDQVVAERGLHWHPKLAITIKGQKEEIPPGIGLSGPVHEELHTHEEDAKDGVIHMEMKGLVTKDETKLGNFFKVWGKEFTSSKIFDKTNGAEGSVKFLVNGKENTEFENYTMREVDTMEIRYE